MVSSALRRSLEALSRYFVGDGTVIETLDKVVQLTSEAIAPADLVGITMLVEGQQRTAAFNDASVPRIDQAQYDTGDGPCLAAFDLGTITAIEDTLEAGEWPAFRVTAASHGVRSTLSFPLLVEQDRFGALNLYAHAPHAFGEADREAGKQFAAQAAIVLANAKAYWDAHELSIRLGDAMEHRAVIEQAKGMLMAAEGVGDQEAFDILVRASQRENVKLREIAIRIVDDAVRRGQQRRRS